MLKMKLVLPDSRAQLSKNAMRTIRNSQARNSATLSKSALPAVPDLVEEAMISFPQGQEKIGRPGREEGGR